MTESTARGAIPSQRPASDPVERWRPVVGWDGYYEVSDHGRVKRVARTTSHGVRLADRVKAQRPAVGVGRKGVPYWIVTLCRDGDQVTRLVHQLVAEAFIGPRPTGLVVRHLDGDHLRNVPSNLAYGTYSENNSDTVRHGHNVAANKTHCKRGHEFNAQNTYIRPSGRRMCRRCAVVYQTARSKRIRAGMMAATTS